jgi:hypothetical protein
VPRVASSPATIVSVKEEKQVVFQNEFKKEKIEEVKDNAIDGGGGSEDDLAFASDEESEDDSITKKKKTAKKRKTNTKPNISSKKLKSEKKPKSEVVGSHAGSSALATKLAGESISRSSAVATLAPYSYEKIWCALSMLRDSNFQHYLRLYFAKLLEACHQTGKAPRKDPEICQVLELVQLGMHFQYDVSLRPPDQCILRKILPTLVLSKIENQQKTVDEVKEIIQTIVNDYFQDEESANMKIIFDKESMVSICIEIFKAMHILKF